MAPFLAAVLLRCGCGADGAVAVAASLAVVVVPMVLGSTILYLPVGE